MKIKLFLCLLLAGLATSLQAVQVGNETSQRIILTEFIIQSEDGLVDCHRPPLILDYDGYEILKGEQLRGVTVSIDGKKSSYEFPATEMLIFVKTERRDIEMIAHPIDPADGLYRIVIKKSGD